MSKYPAYTEVLSQKHREGASRLQEAPRVGAGVLKESFKGELTFEMVFKSYRKWPG